MTWLFGYSSRTALLVGAGMPQIGEFSFIMAMVGVNAPVGRGHKPSGHVVICSHGRIGNNLARFLSSKNFLRP
ncbi:hypothetical protein M1N05_02735 [Dehalococcoidales bacterium]|nr:hypothetical protein [Dehalococcoidales bacterium]